MEIIVTNGFIALIIIIILWRFLYYFFNKVLKYNDLDWKRLEYIWIFAGVFGLLVMVSKNKIEHNKNKLVLIEKDLNIHYRNIQYSLSSWTNCFQYNKTENSPKDIEERQFDQDLICSWSKKTLILILESQNNKKKINLEQLKLDFKTNFITEDYHYYLSQINTINELIDNYNNIQRNNYINNFIINVLNVIGALFLILAFAIRLAVATHNVNKLKIKHNITTL